MSMILKNMIDFQYYYFFLLILPLISTLVIRSLSNRTTHHLRQPPSPPSLPVVGHLHLFHIPIYLFFYKLSNKYGPILYLNFGASKRLVISSASLATEVFKKNDLAFASRPPLAVGEKLPHISFSFVNAPYGEYWKFMKKLFITRLLSPQAIEASRGVRREELRNFLRKMAESASSRKTIDVGLHIMKLANNTICRMVMSTRCSGEDDEAGKCWKLVEESIEYGLKLSIGDVLGPFKWLAFWVYGKKALDVVTRFDELLEKVWREHQERRQGDNRSCESKDLMDILLDVHYDSTAEYKLTRTQIKTFVKELFIAGTDTTSNTIKWALAELINHPRVFNKVRQEINSVVGNSRVVEESDIPSLIYLQAVVKEVLRLHPVASTVPRESREHCKLQGFDIPPRTSVLINIYAINRDPNVWDHPNEFKPERFVEISANEEEEEAEKGRRLSGYFSFGGGRRRCPGMTLAYNSLYSTVAAMVQCFDWKAYDENGEEVKKVDMEADKVLNHEMAHPLICLPILRFNPFANENIVFTN